MKTLWLTLAFLVIAVMGCGPMNTAPKSTTQLIGTVGSPSNSKNNLFYVFAQPVSKPQAWTDNVYSIRFAHSPDLRPASANSKVSIVYWMPKMPDMPQEEAEVTQESDGSFKATLFFSMPGQWEITIKIQEDSLQDEYVFTTEV